MSVVCKGNIVSKIVSGVGRVISKVVSGIGKAVKSVVGSGLGKIVLAASAMYFGGAFINGAMSGATPGWAGAFSDGVSGLANAGKSLLTAGSSVLDGNFSEAGSAISSGFSGGFQPAATAQSAPLAGMQAASSQVQGAPGLQQLGEGSYGNVPQLQPAKPVSQMNPMMQYGLIQTGGNLLGGYFQGKAAEEQQNREVQLAEEQRQRATRNQSVANINVRPSGLIGSNSAGWARA